MTTRGRWLRFNLIGVAGFVVQLVTLAVLAAWLPLAIAVTVAVVTAVAHNFIWHERITWPGQPAAGRWQRLVTFLGANGAISIVTNLAVTAVVHASGVPILAANALAVAAASTLNFVVSDRVVFKRRRCERVIIRGHARPGPHHRPAAGAGHPRLRHVLDRRLRPGHRRPRDRRCVPLFRRGRCRAVG